MVELSSLHTEATANVDTYVQASLLVRTKMISRLVPYEEMK